MDVPWLVTLALLAWAVAWAIRRGVWIAACKADKRATSPHTNPYRY